MSRILGSPTEPDEIIDRLDAIRSSLCEQKGADYLIYGPEGLFGLQRKECPHDFLSSCMDGRLARETNLLAECCKFRVVLCEGSFRYFPDGSVVTGVPKGVKAFQRFTRSSVRKIQMDIRFIKGVDVDYSDDIEDTIQYIKVVHEYITSEKHMGLFSRPKAKGAWGSPTASEKDLWILQGFPGVGPGLAISIVNHFGHIPLKWDCTYDELVRVPKIGGGRASKLWAALQG